MIIEDRKKHMFGVAEFLRNYALEQNMSQHDCDELYTLGLLHDIGYAFLEEKDYYQHGIVGGEFLKTQNYQYWREVYYHGVVNCAYQSKYLDLLNCADMHVDSKGNVVSFEARLEDITRRHGTTIIQLNACQLIDELKAKGYE